MQPPDSPEHILLVDDNPSNLRLLSQIPGVGKKIAERLVLELSKKNVGLNVGLNVALNRSEKATIGILLEDAYVTADDIARKLEVTKRTAERALSGLQKKGYIERIGSKRDGAWRVVKQ